MLTMIKVFVQKITARDFGLWNYLSLQWNPDDSIDADVCARIDTVATVNGRDLGVNGTKDMLKMAKQCGCQNEFGDCVACAVKDAIADSRYTELAAPKFAMPVLQAA